MAGMIQYETIFVGEPTLQDEEVEELIRGYEQIVTTAGGKILRIERWGKRRLAYTIGRAEEGVYVLMVVEVPPALVREIERRYRMNDRILRHLTVRVENEAQLGPSPIMKPRPAEKEEAVPDQMMAP